MARKEVGCVKSEIKERCYVPHNSVRDISIEGYHVNNYDLKDANVDIKFWKKVAIDEPDKCWLWTSTIGYGVGKFYHAKANYSAHRVAYMLHHGVFDLTDNDVVKQTCHNKLCCNPNHLALNWKPDVINWGQLKKRFTRNVIVGMEDDCWLWKRKARTGGMGILMFNGKTFLVHRLAYIFEHKRYDLKSEELILHSCEQKVCCNPKHLHLLDSIRGENNYNAKLTRDQVLEIRDLYFHHKWKKTKLSKEYHVSVPEIYYIISERVWDWLEGTKSH